VQVGQQQAGGDEGKHPCSDDATLLVSTTRERRTATSGASFVSSSPEAFDADPDAGKEASDPVRERDLLTGRMCGEPAALIDQLLIRAQ
jgi:hypothetical protein